MVEEDHPVVEREREVGQTAIVGRGVGQVLGVADGVVGRVADGSAGEPGKPGEVNGAITVEELLRGRETDRPRCNARFAPGSSGRDHDDLVAPGLEPEERLGAQEAEPADLLAADHALEQKRGARSARSGRRPRRASGHRRSTGGKPGRRGPVAAHRTNSSNAGRWRVIDVLVLGGEVSENARLQGHYQPALASGNPAACSRAATRRHASFGSEGRRRSNGSRPASRFLTPRGG